MLHVEMLFSLYKYLKLFASHCIAYGELINYQS